MGEIVNFRRAKKAKARAAKDAAADANRAKHGTPKRLRNLNEARSEKARREIEGSRLDPGKDLKE